jgi:hypothetical protein
LHSLWTTINGVTMGNILQQNNLMKITTHIHCLLGGDRYVKSTFSMRLSTESKHFTMGMELNPKSSRRPLSICLYPDEGHSDPAWNSVPVKLKNQKHVKYHVTYLYT